MKGVRHFIVHVPELNDEKIKTESGVLLYADKRFNTKETANNVFEIVEVPLNYDGPIKKGWWLMVDPSLVYELTYNKGGKQENVNLINRDKKHFKLDPSLIICFRESNDSDWTGYDQNVICEEIPVQQKKYEKKGSLYVPDSAIPKSVEGQMKVVITNESLKEMDVNKGDTVFINQMYNVALNVQGTTYQWCRTKDILGKNTAA